MAEFIASYGMDCRIHDGKRVRGKLKRRPEDFVVTEIDLAGNPVILDMTRTPPPLPVRKRLSLEEEHNHDSSSDESGSSLPDSTHSFDISSLISDEVMSSLDLLARQWEESAITSATPPDHFINLGCHGDKDVRAKIHWAIRGKFPSLKTVTMKNETGDSEIHVLPDPTYYPLLQVLGDEESKKLLSFINLSERGPKCVHMLPPDPSKDHRTKVHRTIDELFGYFLETKSYTAGGPPKRKRMKMDEAEEVSSIKDPCIAVRFRKKVWREEKRKKKRRDNKEMGTDDYFTSFVIRKENLETLEAIQKLSKSLSCHPSQFSFAGMKDRRAITTQNMTVKNVSAKELASLSSLPTTKFQIGSYKYVPEPLRLGDLNGNQFKVKITELKHDSDCKETLDDIIQGCISSLNSRGFVNYYGTQRFGTLGKDSPVNSPNIGLAMLQEDPVKAVNLILQPMDTGNSESPVEQAKKYYSTTGDIEGTLSRIPENRTREIIILKAINRHGVSEYGCRKALMNIPYQMRLMYIHSFTSLIWNHLASFRIQKYGNKPVEGDLIMVDGKKDVCERARPLTSNDITRHHYSLSDIILPVPGSHVVCPGNDVTTRLYEMLTAVSLSLSSFKLLRHFGLTVPGAYRHLVTRPQYLTSKLVEKLKPSVQVLPVSPAETSTSVSCDQSHDVASELHDMSSMSQKTKELESALELEFSLGPSCYATSMLREVIQD